MGCRRRCDLIQTGEDVRGSRSVGRRDFKCGSPCIQEAWDTASQARRVDDASKETEEIMSKRKRSTIRKSREAILNTANDLQRAGIDCSRRVIIVGGARPKMVAQARSDQEASARKPKDGGRRH